MYVCILPYRGSSIYAQITNLNADCIILSIHCPD